MAWPGGGRFETVLGAKKGPGVGGGDARVCLCLCLCVVSSLLPPCPHGQPGSWRQHCHDVPFPPCPRASPGAQAIESQGGPQLLCSPQPVHCEVPRTCPDFTPHWLVEQSGQGVRTRCAVWWIPGRGEGKLPPATGQGPVTGPSLLLPATERD